MIEGRYAGHSFEKGPSKFGLIWLGGFCDIDIQTNFDQNVYVQIMKKNFQNWLINWLIGV